MKNHSELINSVKDRTLSAKGYKFLNQCIRIVSESRGLTRYHAEFKNTKEQLTKIIKHLIIDKELNIEEIKEIIKNSKTTQNENNNPINHYRSYFFSSNGAHDENASTGAGNNFYLE